jgi:TRAP-type C4-dicarboxylate transport system permease small subunit
MTERATTPLPASPVKRLLDGYDRILRVLLTALMGAVLVPITMQILSRFIPVIPRYVWTEEVARFCFVWIIMIGSMVAVRERSHFDVDLLPAPKTPRGRSLAGLVVHGAMLIMAIAFVSYGGEFARSGFRQTSEMSGINLLSIYAAFPVAGVTWVIFLAEKIADDVRLLAQPTPEPAA